jgi:hypothetical protein
LSPRRPKWVNNGPQISSGPFPDQVHRSKMGLAEACKEKGFERQRCWFTVAFNFPQEGFTKSSPSYRVENNEQSSREHNRREVTPKYDQRVRFLRNFLT